MTRPAAFILPLLQLSCGGAAADIAAGGAAAPTDANPTKIDSAIPVCLTALAIAVGGCSDAGGMNLTGDAGDGGTGGTMGATGLRDGGEQQMMDGQMVVVPDAGATVTTPDAQSGDKTGDAMPADSSPPQNMPDPMSVMARLKGVPKHVAFVAVYPPQNGSPGLQGPRVHVSVKIPAFNSPGKLCQPRPFTSYGLWELQDKNWFSLSNGRTLSFEAKTLLLNKEFEKLEIPRRTIINNQGNFVPMSLEDWIAANINNLDAAIAAVVPDSDGCP